MAGEGLDDGSRLKTYTWREYSSIDDMENVEKVRRNSEGLEYIALEKVDGSNFAFETDGKAIEYFSRTRHIEKHENFVGKTKPIEAMRQYHVFVSELFRLCAAHLPAANNVVVYGEYFGGWHPDLPAVTGSGAGLAVQRHVAYSPVYCFYAYDILVDGIWLNFDTVADMLTRAGCPLVAEPVVRGSFAECMAVDPNHLQTCIPRQLGYPLCTAASGASCALSTAVCKERRSNG